MTIRTPPSGPLTVTAASRSPFARRRHVTLQIAVARRVPGPITAGNHNPARADNYDAAMRAEPLTVIVPRAEM
jgi:hypothetical protein